MLRGRGSSTRIITALAFAHVGSIHLVTDRFQNVTVDNADSPTSDDDVLRFFAHAYTKAHGSKDTPSLSEGLACSELDTRFADVSVLALAARKLIFSRQATPTSTSSIPRASLTALRRRLVPSRPTLRCSSTSARFRITYTTTTAS